MSRARLSFPVWRGVHRLGVVLALGMVSMFALAPVARGETACEVAPAYAELVAKADLGCPTGAGVSPPAAAQPFERGWMYWRGDTGQIYAMWWLPFGHRSPEPSSTWIVRPDTFVEGEPERAGLPPPGAPLIEPRRGFGKLWREELGGPMARIGWAKQAEAMLPLLIQEFERGLVLHAPSHTVVLKSDGTWLPHD